CMPVLRSSGSNIYHMGPVGAGALAKIAQNTILALTLLGAAEGFKLAEASGVDPDVFQEIVRHSSAQSHVADDYLSFWAPRIGPAIYSEVLHEAVTMAEELGFELPAAGAARELLPRVAGGRRPASEGPGRGFGG